MRPTSETSKRSVGRWAVVALLMVLSLVPNRVQAANTVSLTLLTPLDQTVGTALRWVAVPGTASDSLVYQFSVGRVDEELQIVRDFSVITLFQWTPMEEGLYQIRVVLKDRATGETATATMDYNVLPLMAGSERAVRGTSNPLVALYSRPSCGSGYVRVRYRAQSERNWRYTNWRACQVDKTMSFHVAGLRANTTYELQDEWLNRSGVQRSGFMKHRTGALNVQFPAVTITDPADSNTSLLDDVLLLSPWYGEGQSVFPFAIDLLGRVIWYYPDLGHPRQVGSYLLRPLYGGTMVAVVNYLTYGQGLREIDLAGNIIRETNTSAISDQLVLLGQDPIISFHHDVVRLPNGRTLVLANVERVLEDVQGTGPVHILGDMILELDPHWQVTWVWNSFDHLDVQRAAVLGEVCISTPPNCPLTALGANDWTHSNTIEYVPADGNLLVSVRHQDWVIKIDYQNGTGTGAVLWRLGKDGDFEIESNDAYPWFSHQHYSRVMTNDALLLFDNGNTRCTVMPQPCNSRGQVLKLDETNRTAALQLNVNLNLYAPAWGSGSRLTNGNYHFSAGIPQPVRSHALELKPDGTPVSRMEIQAALYRSFRMPSLYVPEVNTPAPSITLANLPMWEVPEVRDIPASPVYLPYVDTGIE